MHLLGYSMGAAVALHAAALQPRQARVTPLAGLATFGGWTPMRSGGGGAATGGNRRIYEAHALLPRLGLFDLHGSSPSQVPYDYDELIGSLAPTPLYMHLPSLDRSAVAEEVAAAAASARASYVAKGANASLEVSTHGRRALRDAFRTPSPLARGLFDASWRALSAGRCPRGATRLQDAGGRGGARMARAPRLVKVHRGSGQHPLRTGSYWIVLDAPHR